MREYDQIYEWYLGARDQVTGTDSIQFAFANLPKGSTVIDLGCGTGLPLATTLKKMGLQVIGIDSSKKMIDAFKVNVPGSQSHHHTIQDFDFSGISAAGILCWGCLFHLSGNDQIKLLHNLFNVVDVGGRFLFTSARQKDSTTGEMNGVTFHYYSLGSEKYNALAESAGWKLIHEAEDAGKNYEYLFERIE